MCIYTYCDVDTHKSTSRYAFTLTSGVVQMINPVVDMHLELQVLQVCSYYSRLQMINPIVDMHLHLQVMQVHSYYSRLQMEASIGIHGFCDSNMAGGDTYKSTSRYAFTLTGAEV